MSETPTISKSCYATNAIDMNALQMGNVVFGGQQVWEHIPQNRLMNQLFPQQHQQQETTMPTNTSRRFVQVFIADPNENVPLEESVLFKGDQKLTDLTDTELFFEVPIAETLKAHNEKRVKWLDKDASKKAGKDVLLDPVKIRDLKMVVVTIAQF